jgi:hypothetical protein
MKLISILLMASEPGQSPVSGISSLILLIILILYVTSMMSIFSKAGKPGWAALIPIYNGIVFMEIIGKPWWWLLLWLIPYVNIIWIIWSWNLMVKRFGKSEGFTVGVILLSFIFIPILAFGNSQYTGPLFPKD